MCPLQKGLALLSAAMLVSACNQERPAPRDEGPAKDALLAQIQLAATPIASDEDIDTRLAAAISVRDGLLEVAGPIQSYVLPLSTPWSVQCGIGLTVTLGPASGATANPTVEIFSGPVNQANCAKYGPRLAKGIEALLARR